MYNTKDGTDKRETVHTHTTGSNSQALRSQTTHRAVSGADNRRWDTPAEEDHCGISHIHGGKDTTDEGSDRREMTHISKGNETHWYSAT